MSDGDFKKEDLVITFDPLEREAQNNMSYWFPVVEQIRMRVPKTIMVHTGGTELLHLLDGVKSAGYPEFIERLKVACNTIGYPVFLRTGMTSDKHDWENTCYVKNKNHLDDHVRRLVETSVMANVAGFPFDYSFWAVREFIPTKKYFTYFNGNMPITKEVRYFIKDGAILKSDPYWPEEVFENATPEQKEKLAELRTITDDDKLELDLMARYVAKHFPGFWSVDFLLGPMGKWYLTDMAIGERSYGCPEELLDNSQKEKNDKFVEENILPLINVEAPVLTSDDTTSDAPVEDEVSISKDSTD